MKNDMFLKIFGFARSALAERGDGVIWLFGPLPPPLSGQSNYNVRISEFFAIHRKLIAVSTGGSPGQKLLRAIALPLIVIFFVRRGDHIYTSPPGQNGLWLFLLLALTLRLYRRDHYVHHHSYRSINLGPTWPMSLLCRIGGPYQKHILLSEIMRQKFSDLYLTEAHKKRSMVFPNSYLFYAPQSREPRRQGPIRLGHLSVMTREKGVSYIGQLFRHLVERGEDCRLCLAGPIVDQSILAEVQGLVTEYPCLVNWLGAVHGQDKENFYADTDLFLLPSQLIDEADPLVIIEAFGHGCEVVASDRGCIRERLRSSDALLNFNLSRDVERLVGRMALIRQDRNAQAAACIHHAERLHLEATSYAERFFGELGIAI